MKTAFENPDVGFHERSTDSAEPRNEVPLSPLLYGSAIEVRLATDDLRVFHIRGVRKRAPWIFAVAWLAFVAFMTVNILRDGGKPGDDQFVAASSMIVFWVAGFAMLFAAVRQRHLKTDVLLQPDRLVVRRDLFGWKSIHETSLAGTTKADLVVAYEENYQPVFAVRVQGRERKIQFGAALETADKNWLVDEINSFLHRRL